MILHWILRSTMALLPVLVFLGALIYFDSFKVVRAKAIIIAAAAGMLAAFAGYWINGFLLDHSDIGYVPYSRWISPWLEESLKAALIVYLIRTRRVGMLVDAAIYGFAVGTGFALFENLYFLMMRPETHPAVQVIRGFGTAIMHGGATAVFAIVAVSQAERFPDKWLRVFLPGLVAAVILHGVYNTLLVRPVFATLELARIGPRFGRAADRDDPCRRIPRFARRALRALAAGQVRRPDSRGHAVLPAPALRTRLARQGRADAAGKRLRRAAVRRRAEGADRRIALSRAQPREIRAARAASHPHGDRQGPLAAAVVAALTMPR